jgi:hypothetical protein
MALLHGFHIWSDSETTLPMKIPAHLEKLATGIGLLVLAAGFTFLGFLSFVNIHPADTGTGLFSEATFSIVGSSIGFLVGMTFLAAAVLFVGTLRKRQSIPVPRMN